MFDKIRSRWVTSNLTDSGENPPMISATSGPVDARYHSNNPSGSDVAAVFAARLERLLPNCGTYVDGSYTYEIGEPVPIEWRK